MRPGQTLTKKMLPVPKITETLPTSVQIATYSPLTHHLLTIYTVLTRYLLGTCKPLTAHLLPIYTALTTHLLAIYTVLTRYFSENAKFSQIRTKLT